jgi:hypothetical protein
LIVNLVNNKLYFKAEDFYSVLSEDESVFDNMETSVNLGNYFKIDSESMDEISNAKGIGKGIIFASLGSILILVLSSSITIFWKSLDIL